MLFLRRVIGDSMQPNLHEGSIVFGIDRQPKIGDVVVARRDNQEIIKRVASYNGNGYFLLGDNPSSSTDSRHYGWVSSESIKGVVIGRIG